MKSYIHYSFFLALCFFHLSLFGITAEEARKNKMMTDLEVVKNTFEVLYAPADWKKTYTGWDLISQVNEAKRRIQETQGITVEDYQKILRDFLNSTHDYHVQLGLCSYEMAILPFRIQGFNGQYVIAENRDKEGLKSLQTGDEVLLFDGQPIAEAVQKLKLELFGERHSETDLALAEGLLTKRMKMAGTISIPQGPVTLTVRHKKDKKTETYKLEWIYEPEKIFNHFGQADDASEKTYQKGSDLTKHPLLHKDMSAPFYASLEKAEKLLGDYGKKDESTYLGSHKGFLPNLGKVLWESKDQEFFRAYIFQTPSKRKIGFIRIPHYRGGLENAEAFGKLACFMEKNTEALVVDQTNNPGGSLFYMYALLSRLSDKPLDLPTQRETITQKHVLTAFMTLEDIAEELESKKSKGPSSDQEGAILEGYHLGRNLEETIGSYMQFIIDEWNAGRHFTESTHILGIDQIIPHPKERYSKPILLLINQLDFSCGDFLPAVLQDNKRALLMGTKTAGAGGYVLRESHPNHFGIEYFSYTGSIAERPNRQPIENLGVTPDIPCEITFEDLKNGYPEYSAKIINAIEQMLKN